MRSQATAEVQFRILGPLAASSDGEALSLGGERQRALLALLLVHANEMVSTERLIEQLFGSSRSGSAANAVHVAVSRLRRALLDEGAEMLLTRRGGYVLEIEPEQLDSAVFELVSKRVARCEPAATRRQRPRGWARPSAFGEDRPSPASQRSTSCTRRSGAWRRCIYSRRWSGSTRSSSSRPRGAGRELERLIAAAPLQERLRAQLMLALYRSGRQAEALAAYRDACALLREELGLTPSARAAGSSSA